MNAEVPFRYFSPTEVELLAEAEDEGLSPEDCATDFALAGCLSNA
jgi:hypothetical protein